jgi:SAM-dependent methyltransferase
MRQAFASTEQGYDMLAPKFDHTPFRTPDPVLAAVAREIGEVDVALDVCCGTGAAMRHLRTLCRERVIGLDFSAGMLVEAERRLAEIPGRARVELVRGDALAMPFEGEVDVVTSVGAFGHILRQDEDRFPGRDAERLRHVLARLLFQHPERHHGFLDLAQLLDARAQPHVVLGARERLVRGPASLPSIGCASR